ncbi:MAG: argininosuccinate lyase [Bacteroidota bacterium]
MLWKKDIDVAAWVTRFTVGEDYKWDTLLLPYDITGTLAHAAGLVSIGLLTPEELTQIQATLADMGVEIEAGNIVVRQEDEDCHTVIESYLTEKLGDIGKKIHTGRSRNDQVLTALRLFMRDQLAVIVAQLVEVTNACCALGDTYADAVMPGYTHYQRAMPSTPALWALGYAELLLSDMTALQHAHSQINTSPLGSAAGYGVPFLKLPRAYTAEQLGFESVQTNVTAVQLSRGKLEMHAMHALVQVGATFNRMASDLILFNTAEFGFVTLPAAMCTGSSIMPQKKNPDVLELVRANYHRLMAEMQLLLTLPANLPSGYHRDLQLTKESIMRGLLLTQDLVQAMAQVVPALQFSTENMKKATTQELFATSHALEKVLNGVPFRDAYRAAAAELADRQDDDAHNLAAQYQVVGYPGQTDPMPVRKALEHHKTWLLDQAKTTR